MTKQTKPRAAVNETLTGGEKMKNKYTAGPWYTTENVHPAYTSYTIYPANAKYSSEDIATNIGKKEDAFLIAAAPEMLEALEAAEQFVNSHSEDWYESGQRLLKEIRCVIKKARGES